MDERNLSCHKVVLGKLQPFRVLQQWSMERAMHLEGSEQAITIGMKGMQAFQPAPMPASSPPHMEKDLLLPLGILG